MRNSFHHFLAAHAHTCGRRFRWVFCQLAYLRHCLPGRIQRALDELPQSLDETYERTLEDIGDQNWEYAHRLFQCVSAASRPLRVEELAEFLAFDFDVESIPEYLEDWRPQNPGRAVLSTCSSFLAVVNVGGSRIIQFTHFSVKEYLTSTRLSKAKDTLSRFHISMTSAHSIVAQACLGVLLHLDENVTQKGLKKFPLAQYAAEHWASHARFENVSSKVQDGMKRLFDPRARYLAIWVWIYDAKNLRLRSDAPEYPPRPWETPLHYAAYCGIHDVIKFLIVERSQNVNARGFYDDETPLGIACQRGHFAVAQLLLEHGANKEIWDKYGWNPLEKASSGGHVAVVRVLLDHGADVNARDENMNTSLHAASSFRQAAVARVLLERGAEVNARNNDNGTPLHWALGCGYVECARVLLEYGADPDARNAMNETPLHTTSQGGCLRLVRLLLQYNADVHALDDRGQTPFQKALAYNHYDVMQLLLEHGAKD